MKITHIIFTFNVGGSETMLVDIINEQVKLGNSVDLVIINRKMYDKELIEKLDKKVMIIYINRIKNKNELRSALNLNLYMLKARPDVIHSHDCNTINFLLYTKCLKVITIHDVGIKAYYDKKYDVLCVISQAVKEDIVPNTKLDINIIYNGIHIERLKTNEKKKQRNKTIRLLQISRLEHTKKGQDILITALSLIKSKHPEYDISIDFIGEGSSLAFLENMAEELGISDKINFLGLKHRDFIYEHICDYDLLVQPSIYEGFGLTVVEGIAAKIPVLVSDNDGPMEIIKNGKYGFYFKKGDPKDCADAIIRALNASNIEKLTENAYVYAKENFDIKITAQKYIDLYKHYLSK